MVISQQLTTSHIAGVLPLGVAVPDCSLPGWNWDRYREHCDKSKSLPVFPCHAKCLPPHKSGRIWPHLEVRLTISPEKKNWRSYASDGQRHWGNPVCALICDLQHWTPSKKKNLIIV